MKEEKKEIKVQIQMDDQTAQGMYINMAAVNHNQTEFTLDFIYLQPQTPRGKVRARIISGPVHTKRFLLALQENIKKYEERFGEIKVPLVSPPQTDFVN